MNQVEGNLKEGMGGLEKEKASRSDLEQYITWDQMDQAFKEHRGSPPTPIPADHPGPEVVEALRVVGELADEYESLKDRLKNMEDDLDKKITADDVASLVRVRQSSRSCVVEYLAFVVLRSQMTANS